MGSALRRAWAAGGTHVVATLAGRSARTRGLATGLTLLPDLPAVVAASDVVVSICPPAAAEDVLADVLAAAGATGARPVLADLNAIAPQLVVALAARAAAAGLDLVDGSVSGGPPTPDGGTTLYLSGPRASVLDLPAPGLRTQVLGDRPGTASAVKMCTASVYKGTAALWAQAFQTAAAHGVVDVVLDDLGSDPAVAACRIASATAKSARYVAEMEHIAATQAAAGGSVELFAGIAAVYRRLASTPLAATSPEEAAALDDLTAVLARLRGPAADE
jgi:3-hydroxyisobutyrate dehydrogenase-like beta-hydroxyacid dehydrogenase